MNKRKITRIIILLLVVFSLTFIVTGMFVKSEILQIKNYSDTKIFLRINTQKSKCDTAFLIKPGEKRILKEKKTLKSRKKEDIKLDFLKYLEKVSVNIESDSIKNILDLNCKHLINKKEKKTIFTVNFYSE